MAGPPSGRSRWKLTLIRESVASLRPYSLPGVWKWLKRLRIRLKRGRDYIHSPDPDYLAKERRILETLREAETNYGRVVLLYEDKMGYHRQPTVSTDYYAMAQGQPLARRSTSSKTLRRIAATLDAISGRVVKRQAAHISVKVFKEFLKEVRDAYPQNIRQCCAHIQREVRR